MKYQKMERFVQNRLEELLNLDDGSWDLVLDLIQRRALRQAYVARRVELGMTREDLASKLGVTVVSVARFEEEHWPDPHLSTLRRYALALKLQMTHGIEDKLPALDSDGQPIVEAAPAPDEEE